MRKPSALVVDPDAKSRDLCAAVLTPMTLGIEYAEDGREALVKAIADPPAVVITETRLPFISGYALCELLRADPRTADVAIVVITHSVDPDNIDRARSAGADRVLTKPCLPEALMHAVALGRGRSLDVDEHLHRTPGRRDVQGVDVEVQSATERSRKFLVRTHQRFETSTPPICPPQLRCPSCDQSLRYVRSHIGGVSARLSEQWDDYVCPSACGTFQYRQRTKRVRRCSIDASSSLRVRASY
jgi:CheY-like chemotaxis protein